MKTNINNEQIDFELFDEIDIDELIYQIDNSYDFKLYTISDDEIESSIIIKIFKKGSK